MRESSSRAYIQSTTADGMLAFLQRTMDDLLMVMRQAPLHPQQFVRLRRGNLASTVIRISSNRGLTWQKQGCTVHCCRPNLFPKPTAVVSARIRSIWLLPAIGGERVSRIPKTHRTAPNDSRLKTQEAHGYTTHSICVIFTRELKFKNVRRNQRDDGATEVSIYMRKGQSNQKIASAEERWWRAFVALYESGHHQRRRCRANAVHRPTGQHRVEAR